MKKRYLILAGMLVLAVAAAGCGKKKEEQTIQVTATPTPEVTQAAEDIVDMQQITDDTANITNIMGEKTTTASKLVLINDTGDDVAAVYIRPTTDDDEEWGSDLVNSAFTWKDSDKALYYYDKNAKDEEGKTITSYDIRITYTDEDKNECFFRKLPLSSMTQITLCMDGTGEDAIPYATYLTGTGTKPFSTLSEVKARLGMEDEDSDSEEESDSSSEDEQDTGATATPIPDPTEIPGSEEPDPTEAPADDLPDDTIATAESYIGRSLDELVSVIGSPTDGQEYEDQPDTGKTGYHFYGNFTVSTSVDENGNEIVSGVW